MNCTWVQQTGCFGEVTEEQIKASGDNVLFGTLLLPVSPKRDWDLEPNSVEEASQEQGNSSLLLTGGT